MSSYGKHFSREPNPEAVAVILQGNSQGSLAISSTGAHTAALDGGVYDVWSDTDCFLKVAASASDVTTSTGYLLRANNTVPLMIGDTDKIGAITSAASGTLRYHKVN